jgi:putative aldouronate transport system substrate-binding protein
VKNVKRLLALLLVAVMLMGTMIGCAKKTEDEKTEEKETSTTVTNAPVDSGEVTEAPADLFAEKITFTMSVVDAEKAGFTDSGEVAENFKWFCEKFNVEFDFWPLTWSNYVTQTSMWLNSDSAPDLIMLDVAPVRYGEYLEWVDAGLFRPYPDLAAYPNLAMRFDAMTTGKKFAIDGTLYAFPSYLDSGKYNNVIATGYTYRKDWAQAVGLYKENDVYTWEEWKALVAAVVAQDPGKNGAGNTIGMISNSAWGFPNYFLGELAKSMYGFVKDDSGNWVWGPTLPDSLEAVVTTKQMYDDGLIWADQPMVVEGDAGNNLNAGKLFASVNTNITANGFRQVVKGFSDANPELNAEDCLAVAKVKGPSGKYFAKQGSDQWSQTAMNHNLSDEKAERWLAMLDYLVSDDGYNFKIFGIPEVDWKYDAEGNAVCLWTGKDENGNLVNPYGNSGTSPWTRCSGSVDGFQLVNPSIPQWVKDQVISALATYSGPESNVVLLDVEKEFFVSDTFAEATAGLDAEVYAKVAELMTSDDIATDWTNWVTQKAIEVQPAIDELNANVK